MCVWLAIRMNRRPEAIRGRATLSCVALVHVLYVRVLKHIALPTLPSIARGSRHDGN